MKSLLFIMFTVLVLSLEVHYSFAQSPSPAPIVSIPVPAPTSAPMIAVAAPAAPPEWIQKVIVGSESLPYIGPIVTKIVLYGGMLASVLTLLVGALIGILKILSGVSTLASLTAFADKLSAFQDGKIMYYLKYLSMFNAQKPAPSSDVVKPLAKTV